MSLPPSVKARLERSAPRPEDQPLLLALLLQPPAYRRGPFVSGWSPTDRPLVRQRRQPIPGLRAK